MRKRRISEEVSLSGAISAHTARRLWVAAALACASQPVLGQISAVWNSPTSGNWTNSARWDPSSPNGANDTAFVGASGAAYTVALNSNIDVSALTLDST